MSSIIASRLPPAVPSTSATGRGVLSSSSMPIDCASRRAGSMVSTTTLRPRSAARRARAAEVVVLPTPPEPQHTTMRVRGSSISASTSRSAEAAGWAASGPTRPRRGAAGLMPAPGRAASPRGRRALHERALRLLQGPSFRVVAGLGGQPVDQGPGRGDPHRLQVRAHVLLVQPARGRELERVVGQVAGAHEVDHHAADRQVRGAQLLDPVGGLLHRHLLQHRHQVHRGPRRAEQRHHRVGLVLDGADLGQPGELVADVEELGDPPGGRGVEHDGVVLRGALVAAVALHRLEDLAGQQHVAHAGRDGRGELHDAEAVQRLAGAAEPVVHREVLQQRRLRVDVQGVDGAGGAAVPTLAAVAQPGRDARLGVRQRVDVEDPGQALAPLDLADQHVLAVGGEGQGEGGRHGRLAGAALAGDHVQAHPRPVAAHGSRP